MLSGVTWEPPSREGTGAERLHGNIVGNRAQRHGPSRAFFPAYGVAADPRPSPNSGGIRGGMREEETP